MPQMSYVDLSGLARTRMSQNLIDPNVELRGRRVFGMAGEQLNTARLGLSMLDPSKARQLQELFDEDINVLQMSSANLIFRGVMAMLDLCAGTLYWMSFGMLQSRNLTVNGITPGNDGREMDVNEWFAKGNEKALGALPAQHSNWLDVLRKSPQLRQIKASRDAFTHRWVNRNVSIHVGVTTIGINHGHGSSGQGSGSTIELVVNGYKHELLAFSKNTMEFGVEQFQEFCTIVENTYP